jgi:large subunit ribosomal protein L9
MKRKLLLCKNVSTLGIVGDVVEVSQGYARNFLLPNGLATDPTTGNVRRLAEARRIAEEERVRERKLLEALAERMEGVEITIYAKANEDGVLYGSVGAREIAKALKADGHPIEHDHVNLRTPIRHLDNQPVELRFAEGLHAAIKVWVVREKVEGEEEQPESAPVAGREAEHDEGSDE